MQYVWRYLNGWFTFFFVFLALLALALSVFVYDPIFLKISAGLFIASAFCFLLYEWLAKRKADKLAEEQRVNERLIARGWHPDDLSGPLP
jgi:hypothetical protein